MKFFLFVILTVLSSQAVRAQDYLAVARAADIVIIGETHDNPDHHRLQAMVISELEPTAVVFEMINPEQGTMITPALVADQDALSSALEWDTSGWPDFEMYYPLFVAADGAPIYGAAIPLDDARKAMRQGTTQVFRGFAPRFDLHQSLPEDQQSARIT